MTFLCKPSRLYSALLLVAISGAAFAPNAVAQEVTAAGVIVPNPIDNIVLKDSKGEQVRLTDLAGRPVVLVLGALNQKRTLKSCDELAKLLGTSELSKTNVASVLIVTRDVVDDESTATETRLPDRVYFDPERQAFGAFHVIVMPTIVVLNAEGRVVHSMPGFLPRMPEIISAAVRFAAGKISRESFDLVLDPPPQVERTEEQKRSMRLVSMAEKLRTRGMLDAAEEQFRTAISLDPQSASALIGFGRVLAQQGHADQSLAQYRAALELEPDSIEALLSRSFLQLGLGDEGLDTAFKTASRLAESDPSNPRVHFLLGSIHQRNRHFEKASQSFRRSAKLLLGDSVSDLNAVR